MLKTTYKDARNYAKVNGWTDFVDYLRKNNLKVVRVVDHIGYYAGVYGCNGYLLRYALNNGTTIVVTTGLRTSWMYSCQNSDFGLPLDVVMIK